MVKTVFITGATGNIGGKIVTRILRDDLFTRLILLVRGNSNAEAQQRVENVLKILSPEINLSQPKRRIKVVCGDITLKGLGLPESLLRSLAMEVTHIIHAAATTKFQLPIECARLVNYAGTKNVMAFARQAKEAGNLQRVAHISTAYVCGKKEGIIYEDEIDSSPHFSNAYERTKWEAEQLIRSLIPELPITIFRPSIVVGDSETGRTTAFNVIYTPIKWIYEGILTALPCSSDTPLDIVPVDFVSNAILYIFMRSEQRIGRTYHIVAGMEKEVTVGEVIDLALLHFNHRVPLRPTARIRFLSGGSHGAEKKTHLLKIYEPYLCEVRHFDNNNTLQALKETTISVPVHSIYFSNLLEYCFSTDWGRELRFAA